MSSTPAHPAFTHLRSASYYSFGLGLSSPEELCAAAARSGYERLALTDVNGTYGFLEFHHAAAAHDIVPIYGVQVYHTAALEPGRDRFPMTLLALDADGFANIAALAGLSETAFSSGVALSLEQLEENSTGVVAVAGGESGEIGRALLDNDDENAANVADRLRMVYHDRFFVEIHDHEAREGKLHARRLHTLAHARKIQPLLTGAVHYAASEERHHYQMLRGLRHPHHEDDFFIVDGEAADRSLKPAADMGHLRAVYPDAFDNASRITEMIDGDLLDGLKPVSAMIDAKTFAARCIRASASLYPGATGDREEQRRRIIENETDVIATAGLVERFAFLGEVLGRCRENGVRMGPATALALQSHCAYVTGITEYDPYEIDVNYRPMIGRHVDTSSVFELQLSPHARPDVLQAICAAAPRGGVCYAPAIERFTPARAVRTAAQVVEAPQDDVNEALRIIARHPGESIRDMWEEDRRLGRLYRKSPQVAELLRRASMVEHIPCGVIHSRRTLVVSGGDLKRSFGYSIDPHSDDVFLHVNRDALARGPLIRFDLTTIGAMEIVQQTEDALVRSRQVRYRWEQLATRDLGVWDDVRAGDTLGVFIFEGATVGKQREEVSFESVDDLTNFLAVLRLRDPMHTLADRIQAFMQPVDESPDDDVDIRRALEPTNGHLVFDEQVRDITIALTGVPAADAVDMLMGLKSSSPVTRSKLRSQFMRACADNDTPIEQATKWFDRLLYHAPGTLRRDRVRADALLVCKLFLLKRHHPGLFHAALLNTYVENDGRVGRYVKELSKRDMMLPVDVNWSEEGFVAEQGRVRAGFARVPNMDPLLVERIVRTRGSREFATIDDFVRRVGTKHLTGKLVKQLIEQGAFASMRTDKRTLEKSVSRLFRQRSRKDKAEEQGQMEFPFES